MINTLYLRTFMSLVETNHFTQTAERLNMTQPGVSQHIKKLEAQIGKPLLSRYGKKFELTVAGEHLYKYGLQQAQSESELLAIVADDDINSGCCSLACSGSIAMKLYPKLLDLQQVFPKLSIHIEAAPNSTIIERVKTNLSDIGIITQQVNDPLFIQEQLGEDALCLVLPAQAESDWQGLLALGFINHPDGHHYASQLLEKNFPDRFTAMDQIPHSGYINQLSQILLPVSMGLGFTVIPKSSLNACPYLDRIQSAAIDTPIKETIYLITKKHRVLPRRYQLIKNLLSNQLH